MATIAEGYITNRFVSILPTVDFGQTDLVIARPHQVTLTPYSNPFSNTVSHPDYLRVEEGGAIRSVNINRDGSVMGSNAAGAQTKIDAEKRAELVPFNKTPVPLADALGTAPVKTLSPK